jgi:hypothetical protein
VLLAALLPVGALIGAGLARRALWNRQQQQRHAAEQLGDGERLLECSPGRSGWVPSGDARAGSGGLEGTAFVGRKHARLRALVDSELSGQRHSVAILPLESLPAALSHHVGSLRKQGRSSSSRRGGSSGSGSPVSRQEGSTPSMDFLSAADASALAAAAAAGAADAAERGDHLRPITPPIEAEPSAISTGTKSSSSEPLAGSRQWGLDTSSLQLHPQELEVGAPGFLLAPAARRRVQHSMT